LCVNCYNLEPQVLSDEDMFLNW